MTSDAETRQEMLNQHQSFKAARKAGTASTDQDRTFKKPFRTVDYPPTIDHNMHDDYIRNPPKVSAPNVRCHCRPTFPRTLRRARTNSLAQTSNGVSRIRLPVKAAKSWVESKSLMFRPNSLWRTPSRSTLSPCSMYSGIPSRIDSQRMWRRIVTYLIQHLKHFCTPIGAFEPAPSCEQYAVQ